MLVVGCRAFGKLLDFERYVITELVYDLHCSKLQPAIQDVDALVEGLLEEYFTNRYGLEGDTFPLCLVCQLFGQYRRPESTQVGIRFSDFNVEIAVL